MQASASYIVYMKPGESWSSSNARFALYVFNDGTSVNEWINFQNTGYPGIYSANFDDSKYAAMIICRMDPNNNTNDWNNGSVWNQTNNLSAPTSNVLYDLSGKTWQDTKFDISAILPTSKTFNISGENCTEILPNYMDANSEAGTALTSNGDFTYSCTVTGNVIRKGTYGFKIYDESNNWYSDVEHSYAAWPVSGISTTEDGVYNIVYSFNYLSGEASAIATKTANATISEKYVIAGDEALLGHSWDTSGDYNVLDVTDGEGTLTLNNVSLKAGYYNFKAVKLLLNNGNKYKTIWFNGDNSNYNFTRTSVYNVTFTCTTSTLTSSASVSEQSGYFVYGGTNDWALIGRMTENEGSYNYTFNNANGYSFCIVPNTNLDQYNYVPNDGWGNVIRPSDESAVQVEWSNKNGNIIIGDYGDRKWTVSYEGTFTLTYTPGETATWSIEPYFEREITDGYATFSSDYAVAIPEGVTAYYAPSAEVGKVNMEKFNSGIPANQGAFLEVTTDGIYKFTPATTTDEITTNLLKKGTSSGLTASTEGTYHYVFAMQNKKLCFYNVAQDITADLTGKAYLETTTSIKPTNGAPILANFGGEDGTTGINSLTPALSEGKGVYTLDGRKLNVMPSTKGIYIVNGKKVIVK